MSPATEETLRQTFAPMIHKMGVREAARRAKIHAGTLSQWANGVVPHGWASPRRLSDDQLTRLAGVFQLRLQVQVTLVDATKEGKDAGTDEERE